jgi:hypothetical protein
MAIDRRNFPGVSQDTLEQWLSWVLVEIATGKVSDGWTAGDTSNHKAIDRSLPAERRRDLILNDLSILDPDEYPPRDLTRVKRTVPQYL